MDTIIYYSPIVVTVLVFFVQQHIFVTPEQLEKKHLEILKDIEAKFVTKNSYEDLKSQVCEMKDKIDKIYDYLILG